MIDTTKYEADKKTIPQNIRDIERYLCGGAKKYGKPVTTESIIKKYELTLDESIPSASTGDSERVFAILCENFPSASCYDNFVELYNAMKTKEPLRQNPAEVKKTYAYADCKADYKIGAFVYCVEVDESIYKVYKAKIIDFRIKKLTDGTFDVEYDLKCPCFGMQMGHKLQRNNMLFTNKRKAERRAKERNKAMGWVA